MARNCPTPAVYACNLGPHCCCRQDLPQGPSAAAAAVVERAVDCALVLWFAAGADFQLQLMSGRGGADDLLLQVIC